MKRIRVNLAGLMGLICVSAFVLSAFRRFPEWWPGLLECLALALILGAGGARWFLGLAVGWIAAAIAVALVARGLARATAAGYATFGTAYLWLSVHSDDRSLNEFLYSHIFTPEVIGWISRHLGVSASRPSAPYLWTAHSLLDIAAGTLGAWLARTLSSRLADRSRTTTSPPGPS